LEANCCFPNKLSKCFRKYFIFLLKNPDLKRNIFSRKNIDAAFPNLSAQEKRNLFNKNLKSMIHGIFDTGKAWFWMIQR
jgi:lauroyl/myristoyl acyltransferase